MLLDTFTQYYMAHRFHSLLLTEQESLRAYGTAVNVEVVPFIEIPLYNIYGLIGSLELHA